MILAAGRSESEPELARDALAQLCQIYWAPLYTFVRSRGYAMHDAQDLTQSFFVYLIEHKIYARADRQKGKFRSFLLASLKNFLAHDYDRDDSDYPLRYVAYLVHPVGIAVEYAVLRPIHWLVSRPNLNIVFGHETDKDTENKFEWE